MRSRHLVNDHRGVLLSATPGYRPNIVCGTGHAFTDSVLVLTR